MIDVGVTRMSTKGQIVIPADMRDDFDVGDKLLIIKSEHQLIIKKASKVEKVLEKDLEFAKITGEALKKYENGEFTKMDFDEFMKEVKKW